VVDAGRLGENMEMVENMKQLLLALVFAALAFGQMLTLTGPATARPGTTIPGDPDWACGSRPERRWRGRCEGRADCGAGGDAVIVLANVPSFPPSGLSVVVQ